MKSLVNEAKYTRRYKLEDYEFEEFSLGAVVDERESGDQVLRELKLQIHSVHSKTVDLGAAAGVEEVAEEKEETKPAKKAPKKAGKKNAKSSVADDEEQDDEDSSSDDASGDGESDQDDEAADAETDDDADDSSDETEEGEEDGDESEEEPEEKPAAKTKPAGKGAPEKGKKTFKAKPQTYNRGIEAHKELFSGILRSVNPEWKKSEDTKRAAKDASAELEGTDFLDANGEVIASFRDAVAKLMKPKKKK